jgi:hypothetical protein
MLPTNTSAVTAFLLAVVPGFVATTVWARARTWKGPSGDLRTVLQALSLSLVVQVIVSPLTIAWIWPVRTHLDRYPERVATWLVVTVLVLPFALGLVGALLTDTLIRRSQKSLTGWARLVSRFWPAPLPPSIWDWLLTTSPPNSSFLVLEFNDGRRVGGTFEKGSIAITSPDTHGLFLNVEWVLDEDGNLVEPIPGSTGTMIRVLDDVRSIRILEGSDDGREEASGSAWDPEEGSRSGTGQDATETATAST